MSRYIGIRIAGNFCGRKLSRIGGKKTFEEKTFADCSLVPPKVPRPQVLWRKLAQISTKHRNLQKFSPSKFFRYTALLVGVVMCAQPAVGCWTPGGHIFRPLRCCTLVRESCTMSNSANMIPGLWVQQSYESIWNMYKTVVGVVSLPIFKDKLAGESPGSDQTEPTTATTPTTLWISQNQNKNNTYRERVATLQPRASSEEPSTQDALNKPWMPGRDERQQESIRWFTHSLS